MKKIYLMAFMALLSVLGAVAQVNSNQGPPFTFTGHVMDEKTGEGLIGVSVHVRGTNKGTSTDKNGDFSLQLNTGSVLTIGYVGYKNQTITIGSHRSLEIKLGIDAQQLGEVTINVGYGTQKVKEVTGAVGSITAKQMDTHALGDVNTSLQGKIAGLQITSNSGEPGAGATVRIRGASSVNGSSQPLYIVDGVPINSDSYGGGLVDDASTFSPLADINPQDIESIEVLKDGTASIYGSRASNGVIIITTKSGKNVKKPEIAFSANASVADITRKVGVLNATQFRSAFQDAVFNFTGAQTAKVSVIDSLHPYYSKDNNWQDIMYRSALQYKADVSVKGASKDNNMNYFVSAGYKDINPIIIDTRFKQTYASAKVYYTVSKTISGNTNFNISTNDYNRVLTGLSNQSAIYQALSTMPVYSPRDPVTGALIPLLEGSKPNPVAIADLAANKINRWRIFGNQDLRVKLAKDLEFKTTLGLDYSNTEETNFTPQALLPQGQISSSYLTTGKSYSFINENTLSYKKNIADNHHLTFLAGESYQKFNDNNVNIVGKGLIDATITSINGTSTVSLYNQNIEEHSLLSFFGRANYDYKGRYLFSAIMRADGSSRFGADNRFGYFPSFSAGWRISQEDWFKKLTFVSNAKIRGSFGVTGNQSIGNYAWQGSYYNVGTYLSNVAIVSNGVPNESLKWETTKQSNIGLDLAFLRDRIRFTADAYLKRTTGLLFDVAVPGTTGYATVPANFGSLENKGLEFTLATTNIDKALKWNSTFTFSLNRNKILSLPGNQDYRPNIYNMARVGQPAGVFYGLKALGIYAYDSDNVYQKNATTGAVTPYRQGSANGAIYKGGDVKWEDVNGDGIINDADLQVIGNPNPDFTGGLQNEFSYGNFTLSALLTYSIGNDVFNEVKRNLDATPYDQNLSTDQLRRWRNQGDVTDVPRLVKTDPMLNYAISSRFVEDGSYIRLQNLALNYRIPRKVLTRLRMNNANVGFSVVNLFTWGSYSGYDPEVSSSTNALAVGVDRGSFPRTRTYNLSLNISL
ncbi:TonB-linked outer membrane protein, SusC/RagA family [Pedobacter westerhofensis]|uniref:TonB-linked outer membrane protein, SusC/RagA family n=1 Tax=Pedobacter westerhofensis TaxID=425512 RepID=A0A521FJD2_9SPHI|nr:TonB-dependent receptor [Pedobacter westerhofensis]SMO96236.1 TonB-linked outer membrane protein, SusC/RagA family [Pedobacter westerhofensis]